MKTRTLLGTALLAIVALALTVPAVGQSSLGGPGQGIHWQVALRGETARNSGMAEYSTFRASLLPPSAAKGKILRKFTVETITPDLADGNKLDVYLGPSTVANEPFGKLVGTIDVDAGSGAMILIAAKVPTVRDGSTVTVTEHGSTAKETVVMQGTF